MQVRSVKALGGPSFLLRLGGGSPAVDWAGGDGGAAGAVKFMPAQAIPGWRQQGWAQNGSCAVAQT
jgi:hypothetical protein